MVIFCIWQKKRDSNNMVSIGIQNESGVIPGPLPKKKAKTKTIILMDAAVQTGKNIIFVFLSFIIDTMWGAPIDHLYKISFMQQFSS